jgi:hypothetical protein
VVGVVEVILVIRIRSVGVLDHRGVAQRLVPAAGQLGFPNVLCSQFCVWDNICVEELAISGRGAIRSLRSTTCRLGSSIPGGAASAKPQTNPKTATKGINRPESPSLIASTSLSASLITQMPWLVKNFFRQPYQLDQSLPNLKAIIVS